MDAQWQLTTVTKLESNPGHLYQFRRRKTADTIDFIGLGWTLDLSVPIGTKCCDTESRGVKIK